MNSFVRSLKKSRAIEMVLKRSEMPEEQRLAAREGARRRYAKCPDNHARRCYLRLLECGDIKKPRACKVEMWGLEQRADGTWAAAVSYDEKKDVALS